MAVKSVIDIDVNDGQFKRFSQLFGKYQDALAKQPAAWQKVGKETKNAGSNFQDMTAALMAQNQLHREIGATADKSGKTLQHHASLWYTIHKSTKSVLGNVSSIASWLTKMGIGLGLGALGTGIAGLFGLLAMGKEVSNERNFALSTGTNIGQQKAFELHQGRYFNNPDQLLSSAFLASGLGTSQNALARILGVDTTGGAYKVADRMLIAVQALAKRTPAGLVPQLTNMYPQLGQFGFTTGDLELLRGLSTKELRSQIGQGTSAAAGLALSDRQGAAFQNFVSSIDTTFAKILKNIERDMIPLLGPIEHLMTVIGKSFGEILRSPAVAKGINDFADAIQRFASYIGSKEFQQDLKNLVSSTGSVYSGVQKTGFALGAVGSVFTSPIESSQYAEDYYNNLSGGVLKYLPPFALDTFFKSVVGRKSSATEQSTVNVKTHHVITVKNQTGTNVITTVNQLHGGVTQ